MAGCFYVFLKLKYIFDAIFSTVLFFNFFVDDGGMAVFSVIIFYTAALSLFFCDDAL